MKSVVMKNNGGRINIYHGDDPKISHSNPPHDWYMIIGILQIALLYGIFR